MNKNHVMASIVISALLLSTAGCDEMNQDGGAAKPANNVTASGDDVQKGYEIYKQNACDGCHGETGHGDGPVGQALTPKPRNFHDKGSYKQGTAFENIVKTIETGIPGTAMVAYPQIPLHDRQLIARFIISLQDGK